jgi:antitoxin (DNA-binding transcriptional repressor) of toxin-antitoxin stability system
MSTYSVAEAMENLDELIDRVLKGEEVLIEREGQRVQLRPIAEHRSEASRDRD